MQEKHPLSTRDMIFIAGIFGALYALSRTSYLVNNGVGIDPQHPLPLGRGPGEGARPPDRANSASPTSSGQVGLRQCGSPCGTLP